MNLKIPNWFLHGNYFLFTPQFRVEKTTNFNINCSHFLHLLIKPYFFLSFFDCRVQVGNTKLHFPNGQKSIGSIMKLNRCYLSIISLEHQSPEQNPTETRNLFLYRNKQQINKSTVIIITIHNDERPKIHRIMISVNNTYNM